MKTINLSLMSILLLICPIFICAQSSGGSFIDIIAGPDLIEECTDGIPVEYPYEVNNNCGDYIVTIDFDLIAFGCGGSFRQTFTYTATNDCGDVDVDTQVVDYIDTQDPFIIVEPEFILTCNEPIPSIDDYGYFDCSASTVVTNEELIPNCGSSYSLLRTYTATDDCGFSSVATQTIIVQDVLSPVLSDEPSDLFVECAEELDPLPVFTATDNCDGDVSVYYYETNPFEGCEAYNQDLLGEDHWSFLLPGLPDGINDQFVWDEAGALLTHYENKVVITGNIHAIDDDAHSFFVYLVGDNGTDWSGWNSQESNGGGPNRTFRDDLGLAEAGGDLWELWEYFEIDATESFLAGQGDLAGSLLNISHAPTNLLYGLQIGEAADNKTIEFGVSSWLYFEGWVKGQEVALGPGSFSSSVGCYAVGFFCSYGYDRNWTAHDDCGNVVSHSQYVSVLDETAPDIDCPTDQLLACFTDYSPSSVGSAVAVDNCTQELVLDYLDVGDGNDCPGIVTRFWIVQDECGNINECSQEIIFQDDLGDPCPADINGDNVVNILDFIIFNSAFGSTCSGCPEDINGDGSIDIEDFLVFNSAFGHPCPEFLVDDIVRSSSLYEEVLRLGMRNEIDPEMMKLMDSSFDIGLYPNPNSGNFRLVLEPELEEPLEIQFSDISGRLVDAYFLTPGQKAIEHQLSPGNYTVTLKANGVVIGTTMLTVVDDH